MTKPSAGPPAIRLDNVLTKRGNFTLRVPSFELHSGKITCLVGPTGGGKSTLLLTVLGLLPHQGQCYVQGDLYDGRQAPIKARIGFVPSDPSLLFEELTAHEQWQLTASVYARLLPGETSQSLCKQAAAITRGISFAPPDVVLKEYSRSMRKKVQLVNALLGKPAVVMLDEVHCGLDPVSVGQVDHLLCQLRARGTALLVVTRDVRWVEHFADYVYVLDYGHVVGKGTVKQLKRRGEQLQDALYRLVRTRI
jgi:ABC-type multidrug transport system ATPase subunit